MHNYPTRFASMNRSYFADEDSTDGDYTVDLSNWDPSTARRPVTRSMTRGASVATVASRSSSRVSTTHNVSYRGHQMSLRSSRR